MQKNLLFGLLLAITMQAHGAAPQCPQCQHVNNQFEDLMNAIYDNNVENFFLDNLPSEQPSEHEKWQTALTLLKMKDSQGWVPLGAIAFDAKDAQSATTILNRIETFINEKYNASQNEGHYKTDTGLTLYIDHADDNNNTALQWIAIATMAVIENSKDPNTLFRRLNNCKAIWNWLLNKRVNINKPLNSTLNHPLLILNNATKMLVMTIKTINNNTMIIANFLQSILDNYIIPMKEAYNDQFNEINKASGNRVDQEEKVRIQQQIEGLDDSITELQKAINTAINRASSQSSSSSSDSISSDSLATATAQPQVAESSTLSSLTPQTPSSSSSSSDSSNSDSESNSSSGESSDSSIKTSHSTAKINDASTDDATNSPSSESDNDNEEKNTPLEPSTPTAKNRTWRNSIQQWKQKIGSMSTKDKVIATTTLGSLVGALVTSQYRNTPYRNLLLLSTGLATASGGTYFGSKFLKKKISSLVPYM